MQLYKLTDNYAEAIRAIESMVEAGELNTETAIPPQQAAEPAEQTQGEAA
jgi:hypothetical protein